MTRYAVADEEAIRTASRVRDWKDSGLLNPERAALIEKELRTSLRRTNWALRIVLFVFAFFVVQSAVGFIVVLTTPDDEPLVAAIALAAGSGCFFLADFFIARFHLYRFGVEEACAVCSIALVAVGATVAASAVDLRGDALARVALVTIALGSCVAYWRFGFLYCAFSAGASAAAAPFFIGQPEAWSRVLAAGMLLGIHIVAGVLRRPHNDDYPGDDYGIIESAAWAGAYVVLNLQLMPPSIGMLPMTPTSFYWATYAAIWILPIVGLYRGIRAKHHWMIRGSLLMALATIVTNKSYLRWERHTWDPILLGLLLIGTALLLRRWLSKGDGGHRYGFTSRRVLSSDQQSMEQAALVTAAFRPDEAVRDAAPPDSYKPGGGRSGGAGASGTF